MSVEPLQKFRPRRIQIKDNEVLLEEWDISRIFKFKTPPYVILGSSTAGKTTLALDIIHAHSRDCTAIYYFTSTKESLGDTFINQIPKLYRREPSLPNIIAFWNEIQKTHNSSTINNDMLKKLFMKLYPKDTGDALIRSIGSRSETIKKRCYDYYISMGIDEASAITHSKSDVEVFITEVLSRLIVDKAHSPQAATLLVDDVLILQSLLSPIPKILVIMDDVTSALDSIKATTKKMNYNGTTKTATKIYEEIFADIFTRGRHYNMLTCLFLHNIDPLTACKTMMTNIISFDAAANAKINNQKSFNDDIKSKLTAMEFIFREYKYYFTYVNTLDAKSFCVGRASMHSENSIPLSSFNKRIVDVYNSVDADTSIQIQNNDSEYTDYEEDDNEGDAEFSLDSAL